MSDRIPTLADLCGALADGQLPSVCDGSSYHINALELRRFLNKLRPLPTITTAIDQPSIHPDAESWSSSVHTSVA